MWTGELRSPATATPSKFRSRRFAAQAKFARKRFLLWEMGFPDAKISTRARRTRRRARFLCERAAALSRSPGVGLDGTPFFQIRFLQEGFGSLTLLDKQKLPLIQLDQDSFAFWALPAARAGGALHPARPLFWSADLAAGSNFAVDGQQAEAAVRILGAEKRRFAPIFSFAQPISLPGATSPSTVSRRRLPSGSSAQRSIPSETCPAILRGAKLATSTTVLPTRSSGL